MKGSSKSRPKGHHWGLGHMGMDFTYRGCQSCHTKFIANLISEEVEAKFEAMSGWFLEYWTIYWYPVGRTWKPYVSQSCWIYVLLMAFYSNGESAQAVGSIAWRSGNLCGASGIETQRVQNESVNNAAQAPSTLTAPAGLEVEVLEQTEGHKWPGCLLSTLNMGNWQQNVKYRLHNAFRAFQANKRILCDKKCR